MSTPFTRVLVPVDFSRATDQMIADGEATTVSEELQIEVSPASARSVEIAVGLCGEGGEVRLIHATPGLEHGSIYGGAAGLGGLSTAIDQIHANARQAALACLNHISRDFETEDVTMTSASSPGVALKVVMKEAREFKPDLIVLAASGRSRVTRFFLGSTADRIIREAECPVLVVPTERM